MTTTLYEVTVIRDGMLLRTTLSEKDARAAVHEAVARGLLVECHVTDKQIRGVQVLPIVPEVHE